MNEKIPVTNNTKMPMYVAGLMIPPGETRHFDAHQVPAEYRPKQAEAELEAPVDPLADLVKHKVADVVAALPGLSDADLARVLDLEGAKGSPRKGVVEAVTAEQLARASALAGGDGTGGDGTGGDGTGGDGTGGEGTGGNGAGGEGTGE